MVVDIVVVYGCLVMLGWEYMLWCLFKYIGV